MSVELIIQNKDTIYEPEIEGDITWETDRKGSPGVLKFNVMTEYGFAFFEGNAVRMKLDGHNIFYGFVFTKERNKDTRTITVTAYDQLRYLKNKDSYTYKKKTASEVIKMIAKDFNLKTGTIADTKYKIPKRVEDNSTLFDIIGNALDLTIKNKKQMYVMYDNFGKINLKNISDMKVDIMVDEEGCESYNYKSTIDSNTYNQVKLYKDNQKTKKREIYIAKHGANINSWGVLQFYESIKDGENGKEKANALLKLYNAKTRSLDIKNVWGDYRVRAGSMIVVKLNLGDVKLENWMLVEKCTHHFEENQHQMDLKLRGGLFNE